MLKRRLCEATFEWEVRCPGPLLVSDGRWSEDRERRKNAKEELQGVPNQVFQNRNSLAEMRGAMRADGPDTGRLSFFVPGTSLRGPLRAQTERILRSVLPETATVPATACDPFEDEDGASKSCSQRFDERTPDVPYAAACPCCKLFGCTGTASRIALGDADIVHPEDTQPEGGRFHSVYRDMIGIDRFTGGVHSGANMRFHVLENTAFHTTVTLRNFELWQLGLLAFAFRDFEQGRVALGFGKTKGFGQVVGEVTRVELTYPRGRADGKVEHLGSLASPEEVERYGLRAADPPECPMKEVPSEGLDLYRHFQVEDLPAFWAATAGAFTTFLDNAGLDDAGLDTAAEG